ncbi:MAG: hypothetical protein Kow0047_33830 [Anaerolineae bacterium]
MLPLESLSPFWALTAGPVGQELAALSRRQPIRPLVLPFDLPWAGAWWRGVIIFPRRLLTMPVRQATPWLAHEIVHQLQNRVRGTRTPLRGTLYREVEAEIVRCSVAIELGDEGSSRHVRQALATLTRPGLDAAFALIRSRHWIYRTPLYLWREPEAERMGWRVTLAALGFSHEAIHHIERYTAQPSWSPPSNPLQT